MRISSRRDNAPSAARSGCACTHASRGELGPAGGWLARAERLLGRRGLRGARVPADPGRVRRGSGGRLRDCGGDRGRAAEIGQRFGDADLLRARGAHERPVRDPGGTGRRRVPPARRGDGHGDLGSVSPIVTGLVYCGVILACVEVLDVRRAPEWTEVLARWCDDQPGLVAFTGRCLVHRAEIMQLHGDWPDALEEARRAAERLVQGFNRAAARRPSTGRARCSGSREARRGRGGLRGVAPLRVGAAARPGAPPTRAGRPERGCGRHPPRSRRDDVWSRRACSSPPRSRSHSR